MDNNFEGTPDFKIFFRFLHYYYFPRNIWALLTLYFKKSKFFISEIDILDYYLEQTGLRPSLKRIKAFKKWPVPKDEKALLEFYYVLSFVRSFILGHADINIFLRIIII
jgi:hypothetical protein